MMVLGRFLWKLWCLTGSPESEYNWLGRFV